MKNSLGKAIILIGALFLSACTKEQLQKLEQFALFDRPVGKVGADFCTMKPDSTKSNLKFIFILDKSGSNQVDYDAGNLAIQGTDVDGSRRYVPLQQFLANAPDDPSVYYSLINFDTNPRAIKNFTNSRTDFGTTIASEHNPNNSSPAQPVDGGFTNYIGALGLASDMIKQDITQSITVSQATGVITSSFYVIFFISDGAPYTNVNNQLVLQDKTFVLNAITGMLGYKAAYPAYVESVQVHTGYYFNVLDPTAQQYLADMAAGGNGNSYTFAAGRSIDFRAFSVPVRQVKHSLRDVFVKNMNTTWWNGKAMPDSDGDGIPDEVELRLGSNPLKADSDDNGVSDFVEYTLLGRPCKDAACSPAGAEPFTSCNAYRQNIPGKPKFGDLDKDGLNDCEESLIGSKRDSWDSNNTWIPDYLAFMNGISFLPGSPFNPFADPDNDGVNNYAEIKGNSPMLYDNSKILGLKTYKYVLEQTSVDTQADCYHLSVSNVATASPNDRIRIWIMEGTAIIDDKRYMRVGEKKMTGGNVDFGSEDFQ